MTKADLEAYRDELHELRQVENRVLALQTRLYSLRSPSLTGMPHAQTVESGSSQERAADECSERLDKLIAFYEQKAKYLAEKCLAVEEALTELAPRYRSLMRARYIEGKKWGEIAREKHYTVDALMKMHRKALTGLEGV